MLKNLSDNLNMLMAEKRLNSSELARQTGLPATTIKRIRNNEQSNPTLTTLLPIANYFSISISELIGEKLPITVNSSSINLTVTKLPLFYWQECIDVTPIHREKCAHVLTERKVSKNAFALTVVDHDLSLFPHGSLLIVEPDKTPISGDYVVVAKTGQERASLQKYLIEFDQIYLKSLINGIGLSPLTADHKILGVILQSKLELQSDLN